MTGSAAVQPAKVVDPDETWLVALDIDGTLLTHDGVMSDGTRRAVERVRDAGHEIVLASGRSLIAMLPIAEVLGLREGWMVASNGAVTVRLDPATPQGWTLEDVVTFDPEPALRLLREELPDARYAVEDLGVGFRMNALFPEGELDGEHRVVAFEDLWSGGAVTRVIVRSPESTSEQFHALVERLGLDDVTYAVGWTAWMDLAPLGVSKATALEQVRSRLGIDAKRTLAIGDGRNDIDMLRWAARGVAMGHADDVVKGAADDVTGSIDDDGAAQVLRTLPPLTLG